MRILSYYASNGIEATRKINKRTSNVTQRNVHSNHCCCGKTINITYYERVSILGLFTEHAKHMHCIVLSSVSYLLYHTFRHYLINCTIFVNMFFENKIFISISSTKFPETFLTLKRRDIIINLN